MQPLVDAAVSDRVSCAACPLPPCGDYNLQGTIRWSAEVPAGRGQDWHPSVGKLQSKELLRCKSSSHSEHRRATAEESQTIRFPQLADRASSRTYHIRTRSAKLHRDHNRVAEMQEFEDFFYSTAVTSPASHDRGKQSNFIIPLAAAAEGTADRNALRSNHAGRGKRLPKLLVAKKITI